MRSIALGLCCCSLALLGLYPRILSQTGQTNTVHVEPKDPKEGIRVSLKPSGPIPSSPEAAKILQDLIAANGADLQPTTPWHIELTYDEFDEDGDNVHSGTIEEFYISPKKYKKVIKTDEFAQTEVANGIDLYRGRDQSWPAPSTLQAMREVLSPLYGAVVTADASPDKLDWTVGQTKMPCVVLRNGTVISENGLRKFCYEPGTAIVRYTRGRGWDETVYNDVFLFEHRHFAHDLEVTHGGKSFLKIHLAKIETVPTLDDSLFLPPAGSPGPVSGVVTVPSGILMNEYLVHREFPHFARGTRGKVTVKFTVNKDGRVMQAQATDGPDELRKPAEENVMKMQFRPFLVLDKPVEVESATFYTVQ
jgi:Periplasmic protein TonB, links inner and outer membranes